MSVTTSVGTPPRTNLVGPLTTVFSPDPICMTPMLGSCSDRSTCNGWLEQTCVWYSTRGYWPSNNPACYPSAVSDGFYSPGLSCPSGYTSACSSTAGQEGGFLFDYIPTSGETVVGCCPSFYTPITSNDVNDQTCYLSLTTGIHTGFSCASSISNELTVFTIPSPNPEFSETVSTSVLAARLVQLNWQASDLTTSTTSSPTEASTSTKTMATSTPSPSPTSSGLASGAKAGIGVGIALAVVALGLLLWFLLRHRAHKRTKAPAIQTDKARSHELGGMPLHEVPRTAIPTLSELPDHNNDPQRRRS